MNASFSFVAPYTDLPYAGDVAEPARDGRGGLGTSLVFSAGNDAGVTTSHQHAWQGSPFAISVGAVQKNGSNAPFSSVGPNVLVSAGGVDVYTTKTQAAYGTASGTSFAAPQVTGVVALMLQANDDLGYRDVQQILALSARMEGLGSGGAYSSGTIENHAGNFNGGGMHFNDVFGFGFVDAHAAVRLAETWIEQQTYANRLTASGSVAYSGQGLLYGKTVAELHKTVEITGNVEAEHVQLTLDTYGWEDVQDTDIYLTSPDGTRVRMFYDVPEATDAAGAIDLFPFTSVATMGERAQGTWTVDIIDRTPGGYGTAYLKGITVTAFGHVNDASDTYVYTDEFAGLAGAARGALSDADGGVDTINAAAVTFSSVLTCARARVR